MKTKKVRICNDCGSTNIKVAGYGWNDDGEKPFKIRLCEDCGSGDWEKGEGEATTPTTTYRVADASFKPSPTAEMRCDGCWKWKLLKDLRQHEPTGEQRCAPCYAELVS